MKRFISVLISMILMTISGVSDDAHWEENPNNHGLRHSVRIVDVHNGPGVEIYIYCDGSDNMPSRHDAVTGVLIRTITDYWTTTNEWYIAVNEQVEDHELWNRMLDELIAIDEIEHSLGLLVSYE